MVDLADIHNIAGEGKSLLESAGDIVTKGIPVALASGVVSVLNTGISLGNVFGDFEKINTEEEIRSYDNNLADYYSANKEVADIAGFIGTSLIPGSLGIKGLKALQEIRGGGAIGQATKNITGYAVSAENAAIRAAAETIAGPEQLLFGAINTNKVKAIVAGVGDNVLQGLAFETGVLLTMNQNPVINPDDRSYFSSIWHNIPHSLLNAGIFGAVGGAVGAATVTGKINRLIREENIEFFGARNAEIMGDNSLPAGTRYSYMYDQIKKGKDHYSALTDMEEFASGEVVSQKYLNDFGKSLTQMQTGLDKFATKFANSDGELSEVFRSLLKDLPGGVMENGYPISTSELVSRFMGGAKSMQRVGDILTEAEKEFLIPSRVLTNQELDQRLEGIARALNIQVTRSADTTGAAYYSTGQGQIIAPNFGISVGDATTGIFTSSDVFAHELGHEIMANISVYFDNKSPLRDVLAHIPDFYNLQKMSEEFRPGMHKSPSPAQAAYAKRPNEILADAVASVLLGKNPMEALGHLWQNKLSLEKLGLTQADVIEFLKKIVVEYGVDVKPVQRLIKLTGDERGSIGTLKYPVAGDLGKVTTTNGKLYINGEYFHSDITYAPLERSPTASSIQFLQRKIEEKLPDGAEIPYENLPVLEKALLEKTPGAKVIGYNGMRDDTDIAAILLESKLDHMEELKNAGKDLDYIARALNVPKKFLEDPANSPISLAMMEDHTLPMHGKITYRGKKEMDAFEAQGMVKVYEDRKIAYETLKKAAAFALGEDFHLFADSGPLVNVTTLPEIAGFTKSHNAPYGSTGSKYQQDGKMEQQIADKWAAARADILHNSSTTIRGDKNLLMEFNVVMSKLRSGDSDWVHVPRDLYTRGTSRAEQKELILIQRDVLKEAMASKDPLTALNELTNSVSKADRNIIRVIGGADGEESAVASYLRSYQEYTSGNASKRNVLNAAKGSNRRISEDAFYAPPIDTTRQPYFVMVRQNQPLAADNPFSFIVAPNAEALESKIAAIKTHYGNDLEIFSSTNIKDKKMIEGVYESGDFFQKSAVDSSLKSKGLLTDFVPRQDDYIFNEIDNYLWRQEHSIIRQGIESIRSDEFAQLRFMADNYGELYKSKFGGKALEEANNPYLQLINTSLNVSNKGAYDKYWGSINKGTAAAWNAATEVARKLWGTVAKGEITAEEANKITESHGWRAPYGDVARDIWSPIISDPNALNKFVAKANFAISTLMLRMDALNAVVNTISLPILMKAELNSIMKNIDDPTIVGKLSNLMSEQVPGTSHRIPSLGSLLYQGTGAYARNDKAVIGGVEKYLRDYFTEIGSIKTDPQLLRMTMDAVPMSADAFKSKEGIMAYVSNLTKRVGELGTKYTGNDLAEDFVRFQAAHAMWRVAIEAGITNPAELASYINTYVNRVHGNYLASQRPSVFQGPIGQAIGLFQTYQFNMIQQMTRYIQQGDKGAVVAATALQNTIFGMQSNPLFYQLNQYIGESNRKHHDIISTVDQLPGGRWLLYGLGANTLQMNLYSRGDLTPRYASILPTRLEDTPLISIPTKAIGSFLDSMSMINKGAPVVQSILNGIAHSGFNRPLSGLASLAAGGRTTSQATMLSAYNDIDGFLVAATLAGGKPLNEAVLLDNYNRQQAYKASDQKKIQEVAEAVRLTVAGQRGILNPEQTTNFLSRYAEAGGSLKNANEFLMNATNSSTQTVIDKMKNNYNSPSGARMRDMMHGGGSPGSGQYPPGIENLNIQPTAEVE